MDKQRLKDILAEKEFQPEVYAQWAQYYFDEAVPVLKKALGFDEKKVSKRKKPVKRQIYADVVSVLP